MSCWPRATPPAGRPTARAARPAAEDPHHARGPRRARRGARGPGRRRAGSSSPRASSCASAASSRRSTRERRDANVARVSAELTGRVALVTGASRGLGAAIARELAARGAAVALNYLSHHDGARALAAELTAAGRRAACFPADTRDPGAVARLTGAVARELGPVDILVCNAAAPLVFGGLADMSWEQCLGQLEVALKSPLLLAQALVPAMPRGGRIVFIGSEVVERGAPGLAAYAAAKSAQLGLVRAWARELAPAAITVNLVAPGWIPVERHQDVRSTSATPTPRPSRSAARAPPPRSPPRSPSRLAPEPASSPASASPSTAARPSGDRHGVDVPVYSS